MAYTSRWGPLLVIVAAVPGCSDELIRVEGSSCEVAADCLVHPSCAWRENGCRCKDSACWFDPSAPQIDPATQDSGGCRSCHGSNANPAPPGSLTGLNDRTTIAVGAHQAHLRGGLASRPVSCGQCHIVPQQTNDPGHLDDNDNRAEMTWGDIATAQGARPMWNRNVGVCTNYCHGATFANGGGKVTVPQWTKNDGSQAACGSCHGLPPGGAHPPNRQCEMCHLPTAGPNQTIANRNTHVDGVVQVNAGGCNTCHGSSENPAPPKGLGDNGPLEATALAVGAHQAHLKGGRFSRPIPCDDCHLVPDSLNAPGHIDDGDNIAELTWGPLATQGGVTPLWDRNTATCTNYCHGAAFVAGNGSLVSPNWTRVDGSQAQCGTCHGLPPGGDHPANDRCELCHLPTAGINQTIAKLDTHIDGTVQVTDGDCTSCHGSDASIAPPQSVDGLTDTRDVVVGAHQTHLTGGNLSRPVPCDECHLVPRSLNDPGHVDTGPPAEVTFGLLATMDGADATWDRTSETCTNYCHGSTLRANDGTVPAPVWTQVDGSQAKCGACHGLPPGGSHPADDRCDLCHLPTAGPDQTIASTATHIDGVLQVTDGKCDSCHGGSGSAAPPTDVGGHTDTTLTSVGAHRTHLKGGEASKPVDCSECHVVPQSVDDPGHVDPSPAEVVFGPAATAQNVAASWNRSSTTCTTYCHGANLDGGSLTTPDWTVNDGSQAACGACHGLPPGGDHPANDRCELCHLPTAGPGQTIAHRDTHVDGVLQVTDGACNECHGGPNNAAPPQSVGGLSDTSLAAVGAHQTHLRGGNLSQPVACNECHLVPSKLTDPGHVDTDLPAELVFGNMATTGGVVATYDPLTTRCTNYCHGSSMDGTITNPSWTVVDGSQVACGACHGIPPRGDHPADNRCELCHLPTAGPGQTIANISTHVDGVLQVTDGACDSCHGGAGVSAPPQDVAGNVDTTSVTVGAHRRHLSGGTFSKPVACDACHVVPRAVDDPGHVDPAPAEVRFGSLATTGGAAAIWDRSSQTCTTYCHGAAMQAADGTLTEPLWTRVDGSQAVCGSCHGLPPGGSHPQSDRCELCHLPTAGPNRSIANRSTHIDGVVQASTTECNSCHGGVGNSAPPSSVDGLTDTGSIQVGAHQSHLSGGNLSKAVACDECHVVPSAVDDPGHIDTGAPAEVAFGVIANLDGASARWDRTSETCTTYCHGETLSGGINTTPTWTIVDNSQVVCGSCHGTPPAAPHPQDTRCNLCHLPTSGPGLTVANRDTHIDGIVQVSAGDCASCHGGAGAAPPEDVSGNSSTSAITVGAHQAHLSGGDFSKAVQCNECHVVPAGIDDPGHIDPAPAELTFGPTAQNNTAATWNRANGRCTNYCHGATLNGGSLTNPVWTTVDGTQDACGTCHGMPPGGSHPANSQCDLCHLPTGGPNQTVANPDTHIDGILQVTDGDCSSCHGDSSSSAPPKDLDGDTSNTDPQVGAHRAHVVGTGVSAPVACSACHRVPTTLDSPGHVDTARPAEVVWSGRAVLNSANPSYSFSNQSCANTYCHGKAANPVWNEPWAETGSARCSKCHGAPPPAPHPQLSNCESCHGLVVATGMVIIRPDLHVDGHVDFGITDPSIACNVCHGSDTNEAPPTDLDGNNDTALVTVGAHQSHLTGGSLSAPVACDACHLVPASADEPNHIDGDNQAEVVFGSLARTDGVAPSWDRNSAKCVSYCHGASLSDGTNTTPTWTTVDGTEDACGTCHGVPPGGSHPADTRCDLCHLPTAGPGQTIANLSTHIDGVLQVAADSCDACHGNTQNSAPPRDTTGNLDTTFITVGAHQKHLAGGEFSKPVECSECHLVPAHRDDPGHLGSPPAEVTFGPLASRNNSPSWNRNTGTCSNYCHGAGLTAGGGADTTPIWNTVDGTQDACGTCHGLPPGGSHPQNDRCELCHLPTAGPGLTIAQRSTHIDGVLQTSNVDCNSCHGSVANNAPPLSTEGLGDTSETAVGAHQTHLAGGSFSRAVACSECHVVPAQLNAPGHLDTPLPAELTWGALSSTDGVVPVWDRPSNSCSNYCHGASLRDGTNTLPIWTVVNGSQGTCGSCHGLPPGGTHPSDNRCELCHLPTAGPGVTIASRSTHIDGILEVTTDAPCDSCHGRNGNAAPPLDTNGNSDTSLVTVGAHRTHLKGSSIAGPISCGACHVVPLNVTDPGHIDSAPAELLFGPRATAFGASAAWNRSTGTCTNYCHGATLLDGNNTAPVWTLVDGSQDACGTCHGLPPGGSHPAVSQCELCHLPTAGPNHTIADTSTHVDGVVQVTTGDCTSCHGDASGSAPPTDLNGDTTSTDPQVGAHRMHMVGTGIALPVPCGSCHLVPSQLESPGHVDTPPPAEVILGGLAAAQGSSPTYDGSVHSCSGVYCHGAQAGLGQFPSPTWNQPWPEAGLARCDNCHGLPPAAPHPQIDTCETCHAPVAGPAHTIVIPSRHVDGIVDIGVSDPTGSCNGCHGNANNAAPPTDLSGNSSTRVVTVGAHQAHLGKASIANAVACEECHLVPAVVDDTGHIDGDYQAEVIFGSLARTGGVVPSWDRTTQSCQTYCHGATLSDGSQNAPIWTRGASQAACGTCHGVPPASGHPQDNRCDMCHLPTAGPNQTLANLSTHIDGVLQVTDGDCSSCHGSAQNSAPPSDVNGNSSTSLTTVGAHQTHLSGGLYGKPVACNECHVVPTALNDPGHVDPPPAEVTFGPLTSQNGGASYNGVSCSNTWCHNQPGGDNPTPTWTVVDGTQADCGSCHGLPPNDSVHAGAASLPCSQCHLPTAGPGLTIARRDTHGDGIVQATAPTCDSCHGGGGRTAPPQDLDGDTANTDREVGAHAAHVDNATISNPVACDACHLVPKAVDDPGHVDSPRPAELNFGGIAVAGGATPAFDPATLTCTDSYCHSIASTGAQIPDPVWNEPWADTGAARCDNCHGTPPAGNHPQIDTCEDCHAPVAGPGLTIATPARHIDGIVDVSIDPTLCTSCHGQNFNPAPPLDLDGDSATTDPQVGAHQLHLQGSGESKPVPCNACHILVTNPQQPGHWDTPRPAEVIFGSLANRNTSTSPTYDGTTCANTYCHGNTLPAGDGTNLTPSWTGGSLSCTSCHGNPPSTTYHNGVAANACSACHPDTMRSNGTLVAAKHVDGVVDTSATCDACHGASGDPAPPKDLAGNTSSAQVGAHQIHLSPAVSAPVACADCHKVPTAYGDPGHVDANDPTPNQAEVNLVGRARLDGVNPSYNFNTLRCSNTYCHGNTLPAYDGTDMTPSWNGGVLGCDGCHGMPPASPAHVAVSNPNSCDTCHTDTAGPNQTIKAPALHIDGVVEVSGGGCSGCHNGVTLAEAPPKDASHNAHNSTLGFDCTTCHGHDGSGPLHDNGTLNVVFDTTVRFPGGTTMTNGRSVSYNAKTQTCAVGCHNPVLGNPGEVPNLSNTEVWNSSSPGCTGCHDEIGTAPPFGHDVGSDAGCEDCHDQSTHTQGSMRMLPRFNWTRSNPDNLCKGCHNGGGGSYFGGQPATDVAPYWTTSSHGAQNMPCYDCHTYHRSMTGTGNPPFVDRSNASCLTCHSNLNTAFGYSGSHHRIEDNNGLYCISCHNPHLSQAHPLAAVNPDNKWQLYNMPDTAVTQRRSNGDYRSFCLACHDGSAPQGITGALNISQALNGGSDPSLFRNGSSSLHRQSHSGYNCQNCHSWHGTSGTSGINRGRLLPTWFNIRQFSNGYSGKSSCSTNVPGGSGFRCH